MLTLNTVKIGVGREAIRDIQKQCFTKTLQVDGKGRVAQEVWTLEPKILGLNKLQIKGEEIVIEFSAKILKGRYSELINRNTFEEALSNIDVGIELYPYVVIEGGKFLKIDVTKIDKEKLYKGAKGTYLDAQVFVDIDDADQYGNNGMITQAVTKEARDNGERGAILGNCRVFWRDDPHQEQQSNQEPKKSSHAVPDDDFDDDVPF